MTESELFAVMVAAFSTVSGSVLAVNMIYYFELLWDAFRDLFWIKIYSKNLEFKFKK